MVVTKISRPPKWISFPQRDFFLLSFIFRNCVSLNPLLWLCFKNCFCQRHNAPNHHTCLCRQISESFFVSERKKRLCDKIDDIQQDINIINIKTIKSSTNTCIKPKPLKKTPVDLFAKSCIHTTVSWFMDVGYVVTAIRRMRGFRLYRL